MRRFCKRGYGKEIVKSTIYIFYIIVVAFVVVVAVGFFVNREIDKSGVMDAGIKRQVDRCLVENGNFIGFGGFGKCFGDWNVGVNFSFGKESFVFNDKNYDREFCEKFENFKCGSLSRNVMHNGELKRLRFDYVYKI